MFEVQKIKFVSCSSTDDEDGDVQTLVDGEDTRKCLLCLSYGDQDGDVSSFAFSLCFFII